MDKRLVRLYSRIALVMAGLPILLLPVPTVNAQSTSSISGRAVDFHTRQPIVGATIAIAAIARSLFSDGDGNYAILDLGKGSYVIEIHAVGYIPSAKSIELGNGETAVHDFVLTKVPATLPSVTVKGSRNASVGRRFEDFERRRAGGAGQYLTREQIEAKGAMNLSDLIRDMRGIRTECAGFTCTVEMVRSVHGCAPVFFVDGRISTVFGPSTPVSDVQGIEVYLGPAQTPAEFSGSDSACGVIAIWTKSSPY